MARKQRNKEPAITRTCPDGTLIISREWIGWVVISGAIGQYSGIESILAYATRRLNEEGVAPEGKYAMVSYDGRAIVTYVDKMELIQL